MNLELLKLSGDDMRKIFPQNYYTKYASHLVCLVWCRKFCSSKKLPLKTRRNAAIFSSSPEKPPLLPCLKNYLKLWWSATMIIMTKPSRRTKKSWKGWTITRRSSTSNYDPALPPIRIWYGPRPSWIRSLTAMFYSGSKPWMIWSMKRKWNW